MDLLVSEGEGLNLVFIFPSISKVCTGTSVHDADVSLQNLRPHELRNQLSKLLFRSFSGRREDLFDRAGIPNSDKLVLVGEQEFVASRTAEDGSLLPKEGGLEDLGGKFGYSVEEELFRLALPSRSQELKALSDHGVAYISWREVFASELGSVPI